MKLVIAALMLFGLTGSAAFAQQDVVIDNRGHPHKNCPPGYNLYTPRVKCNDFDRQMWKIHQSIMGHGNSANSNSEPHTLKLTREDDGQFLAPCRIGGFSFRCLLDTGAAGPDPSAMLILSINMAQEAGVDISHVRFDETVTTGDGVKTASASVTIPSLSVGPFVMSNPTIIIVAGHENVPIVTAHFIQKYDVHIRGDTMTISSE